MESLASAGEVMRLGIFLISYFASHSLILNCTTKHFWKRIMAFVME